MAEPQHDLARRAGFAAARGSLLFHLFLAEAVAGDALAGHAAAGPDAGWAIDVGPDGYEVAALSCDPARVWARVTYAADGAALVEDGGRGRPSARQLALAAARSATAGFAAQREGRHAALVAPPPRAALPSAPLDAYAVRLGETGAVFVAGPHWRLWIGGEGRVSDAVEATDAQSVAGRGAQGGLILLTHAREPTPSELHVFLSLNHGVVLEVATPSSDALWRVDGERIERLG